MEGLSHRVPTQRGDKREYPLNGSTSSGLPKLQAGGAGRRGLCPDSTSLRGLGPPKSSNAMQLMLP